MMDQSTRANEIISNILRYGSYLSIFFMTVGLLLFVLSGNLNQNIDSVRNLSLREALGGIFRLDSVSFMTTGIITLLLTPFLRVLSLFLIYVIEKDRIYAMISFGVLLILTASMLIPGLKI